jgi:ribosomal protein S18 acetylase RimI-like enzyme
MSTQAMSPEALQQLTALGWPAIESQQVAGWQVRFSSGITRRANSVLAASMPDSEAEIAAAVDEVERRSAERWLAPTFQLWQPPVDASPEDPAAPETEPAHRGFYAGQQRLAEELERRGYVSVAPTRVLWMDREDIPTDTAWDRRILVNETLTDDWLDAHLSHTSGGGDPASRIVHRRLLGGGRNRFYSCLDADGAIAALAKVSMVTLRRTAGAAAANYAGIYGVWVREDQRGRGLSAALTDAMFNHLVRQDIAGCWLQVEERSTRALSVYQAAGFTVAARYRYLTQPS